jgi:hypothetical protein
MNILKFIESFTENMMNVKGSREIFLVKWGFGKKNAALTTIPFGIAALTSTKASAAGKDSTSGNPIAALQLALTLEYLEEFYNGFRFSLPAAGGREEKCLCRSLHTADHVTFTNGLG